MSAPTIRRRRTVVAALAAILMLAAAACADRTGDDGGLDMRSRGEGERNERLGNDPAEQNTGRGSTPEPIDQRNAPAHDDTPQN